MESLKKLNRVLAGILIGTVVISAASLLLPVPEGIDGEIFYNPFATAISLVDMGLGIGAGILFFRARRNFKANLKPAYLFMAAAAIATGTLTLFFPVTEYFWLWPILFFNIGTYFPYFFGGILMYLGARQFYRAVGLRGWISSAAIMGVAAVAIWFLYAQVPHTPGTFFEDESLYDFVQFIVAIPIVGYVAAAFMMLRVRGRIGMEYKRALTWMSFGLITLSVSAVIVAMFETFGYENWFFENRLSTVPIILADIFVLAAGYQMNRIGLSVRQGLLARLFRGKQAQATSLDVVIYTAGLAANPSQVEPLIDDLRFITSQVQPGQTAFTDEQHAKLRDIYLGLEEYLVTKDELRDYNKPALRASIAERFDLANNQATFWANLPA